MAGLDDFDDVRRDPDPLRRGRRATELMSIYQQRATELARLRREAIEEAHLSKGLSYTEIAAELGITKGRVTQIRTGAPSRERAFFGVGPVHVGAPMRYGTDDRMRTYVDAADIATQNDTESLLAALSLASDTFAIHPTTEEPPAGDVVVICGPKSAPVGAALLESDPALGMVRADNRWWLTETSTGERFGSPMTVDEDSNIDLGYMSRRKIDGRVIVHIAGIHTPGSRGVVHFLTGHLARIYRDVGDVSFSLAIRCHFDGLTITGSELLSGPHPW